jgi:hypothetical protein
MTAKSQRRSRVLKCGRILLSTGWASPLPSPRKRFSESVPVWLLIRRSLCFEGVGRDSFPNCSKNEHYGSRSYSLRAFTMTPLCLQQLTTKGFDPRPFSPPSMGKLINLHLLSTSCYLLWIRIREPFLRTRLVPVPVPTSWQPEVDYFLSPYKTTLIGISFKEMVVFAPLKKWINTSSHNLLIEIEFSISHHFTTYFVESGDNNSQYFFWIDFIVFESNQKHRLFTNRESRSLSGWFAASAGWSKDHAAYVPTKRSRMSSTVSPNRDYRMARSGNYREIQEFCQTVLRKHEMSFTWTIPCQNQLEWTF